MILIADSGSSKTDWRLVEGNKITQYSCKGLNPDFNSSKDIESEVATTFKNLPSTSTIKSIYFYGAGCSSDERNSIVEYGLKAIFGAASIEVEHDLLGAARAACGNQAGLAGILGTGSNCCLFDGKEVSREYRTGGFVIGDEGGGVDIGKRIVKAYIEDYLPTELRTVFDKRYNLSVDAILQKLYKEPQANRFLASFAKFALHHKENAFISELIQKAFSAYFKNQVLRYPEAKQLKLNLVGSIAFYFQEYIRNVGQENGVQIGTILEKPISGLTLYHSGLS